MNALVPTVRLTATCDFYGAENQLTINHVPEHELVGCSTCGGHLGTNAELVSESDGHEVALKAPLVPAE